MYISNEDLVMTEHDFLQKRLKVANRKVNDSDEDYIAIVSDFFVYAGAINDFVEELIGDEKGNAQSE